ncbi:hypothetical protein [Thalassobaculum sp.]|uniref:hypothetical protein n=1 Tax=Thalassobaculum sp. TaxID=2022740 RepID=UPI0032EC4C41
MMYGGWEGHGLGPLLPMLVMAVPFAIGNYLLARRLGQTPWLWAAVTLIPVANYFFMIFVAYTVVFAVLDRLATSRDAAGTAAD